MIKFEIFVNFNNFLVLFFSPNCLNTPNPKNTPGSKNVLIHSSCIILKPIGRSNNFGDITSVFVQKINHDNYDHFLNYFKSHSILQIIKIHYWEGLRNLGVAGQGWSHTTKGVGLRFFYFWWIFLCRNITDQLFPSGSTDDQIKLQSNWKRIFSSGTWIFLYWLGKKTSLLPHELTNISF